MYVYDYQWVCMYVWLILYIWCSLRWKMSYMILSFFFFFFFDSFQPCTVPVGVSDDYAREWVLATAECDFTEREAVWTGFLYGLI